ncbi:MAG: ubiquinol-cytochrome c reductase iron-sulfur subunit [Proteobacteria bacterium]|nr:ubiquinol-cytochrome c reductase iron-sulfur subunit [Pseudomonadota bacterium]
MANEEVNTGRRRFLTATTAVVGAVGVAGVAVPFARSWLPSVEALLAGGPVDVDISKLDNEPGMFMRVKWRGQPVFVYKRTPEELAILPTLDALLVDPKSDEASQTPAFARNEARAIKPAIGVLVGICTHLGCVPIHKPEVQPQPFDPNWKGGFFCPCHGSRYDLAGRVFKNVPAPKNLEVPDYRYVDDNHLVVGEPPKGAA